LAYETGDHADAEAVRAQQREASPLPIGVAADAKQENALPDGERPGGSGVERLTI